jgi:hypothetical protein
MATTFRDFWATGGVPVSGVAARVSEELSRSNLTSANLIEKCINLLSTLFQYIQWPLDATAGFTTAGCGSVMSVSRTYNSRPDDDYSPVFIAIDARAYLTWSQYYDDYLTENYDNLIYDANGVYSPFGAATDTRGMGFASTGWNNDLADLILRNGDIRGSIYGKYVVQFRSYKPDRTPSDSNGNCYTWTNGIIVNKPKTVVLFIWNFETTPGSGVNYIVEGAPAAIGVWNSSPLHEADFPGSFTLDTIDIASYYSSPNAVLGVINTFCNTYNCWDDMNEAMNFHASLIPKWSGYLAEPWLMDHQEFQFGTSVKDISTVVPDDGTNDWIGIRGSFIDTNPAGSTSYVTRNGLMSAIAQSSPEVGARLLSSYDFNISVPWGYSPLAGLLIGARMMAQVDTHPSPVASRNLTLWMCDLIARSHLHSLADAWVTIPFEISPYWDDDTEMHSNYMESVYSDIIANPIGLRALALSMVGQSMLTCRATANTTRVSDIIYGTNPPDGILYKTSAVDGPICAPTTMVMLTTIYDVVIPHELIPMVPAEGREPWFDLLPSEGYVSYYGQALYSAYGPVVKGTTNLCRPNVSNSLLMDENLRYNLNSVSYLLGINQLSTGVSTYRAGGDLEIAIGGGGVRKFSQFTLYVTDLTGNTGTYFPIMTSYHGTRLSYDWRSLQPLQTLSGSITSAVSAIYSQVSTGNYLPGQIRYLSNLAPTVVSARAQPLGISYADFTSFLDAIGEIEARQEGSSGSGTTENRSTDIMPPDTTGDQGFRPSGEEPAPTT